MTGSYRARLVATRPEIDFLHDADVAVAASTIVGFISERFTVDHSRLQAALVADNIVGITVVFEAPSDEDANTVVEHAAQSLWGWHVEMALEAKR